MFGNNKPMPQPRLQKEGCKIKIKNTAQGKQIEFSGNCTKEQLEMAKSGFGDSEITEEE